MSKNKRSLLICSQKTTDGALICTKKIRGEHQLHPMMSRDPRPVMFEAEWRSDNVT